MVWADDISECATCHEQQVRQWQASQHSGAMAPATESAVAGDFSGSIYADTDIKVRFERKAGDYLISTEEAGTTQTWHVQFTFGTYPLQQYLIDIGNGRLQAFNIAWDTRPVSTGGQRWFRLDEPDQSHPGDALHWTGVYQNWNSQCADCHSTGLIRNYDSSADSYNTGWDHVAVGCTACHETAGEHAAAAQEGRRLKAGIELAAMGAWLASQAENPPRHTGFPSSPHQVKTCGRCHSLRTSLTDEGSGRVHDEYSLSRLEQPLYYSGGRVQGEAFVLGSFEQSKMFQAGVVCTDCHNAHTGKLNAEGNAVCTRCHNADDFETPKHHRHQNRSAGAQCVNCHMPESTFMKIDPRREHSFMVPRPDISKASGSPDVCLSCHTNKSSLWSIKTVDAWFPDLYRTETWHDVQQRTPEGVVEYLNNPGAADLRRATLLEQHGEELMQHNPQLVVKLIANDSPVIRESAHRTLRHGTPEFGRELLKAGLADSSLAVRLAAFESSVRLGVQLATRQSDVVREEYERFLDMQSDSPSGLVLRARYLLARDYVYKAERALIKALDKDPGYVPATILLTDILRSGARNLEAIDAINRTLASGSDDARLIHLRGLVRLKLKHYDRALRDLEQAMELSPQHWFFGYRYAVVLFRLQRQNEAKEVAQSLVERFPGNSQLEAFIKQL